MHIKKIKMRLVLLVMVFALGTGFSASAQTLQNGSSGTEVKILQMNLNGLGYAKITTDGIYGWQTAAAVKAFQNAHGLTTDGIAGGKTLTKIKSVVTGLQNDLKLLGYTSASADGIYGTNTKNAVRSFQSSYGLTQDGIAGYRTLQKISSLKTGNTQVSNYSSTPSKVVTYSLSRDGNKNITRNFKVKEFKCNDGSDLVKIDLKLAALLQDIRDYFGKSVIISSAYRTASYNKKVGGSSGSLHLFGQAADISITGVTPREIARYAESLGVKGIGLYSSFVHVDTRSTKYYWAYSVKTSTFK
ncbi:MAG: peptidoglycan-binding protein [Clostridia bacterium]|nr:peptidoglycan-binding protein [Clostridia bacterium]MBQ8637369.1 peptidoglycan-binding protein [Clostridia bacterium]